MRRDHILAVATVVFAQHGYERASMRSIAREADVSLAGLYHYYDSKEQLLFVIQFRMFSSLLTTVRERLNGVEDPKERLSVLVHGHISQLVDNMAGLKVCSHELDSLCGESYEQTEQIRREYYQLARSIIQDLLAPQPGDDALHLHVATMSLFGTLNWLYRWFDPSRDGSPKNLATRITDQFLFGICGSNPHDDQPTD